MSDKIIKSVILDGKVRIAVIDTTETLKSALSLHQDMSPLATATLGRCLTCASYISSNLKNDDDTFSMTIGGQGALGKTVVAGNAKGCLRGFVQNPSFDPPLRDSDGKLDVRLGVGTEGEFVVIKDVGLKTPYIGRTEIISGEIGEDFAYYLLKSEGIKSAVAVGVKVNCNGVVASGGVIAEALPDCEEEQLVIVEDIFSQFSNISTILEERGAEGIDEFYFSHLATQRFEPTNIMWKCSCSDQRIVALVKNLGKKEALSIIDECSTIDVKCQFCGKTYSFDREMVNKLFD